MRYRTWVIMLTLGLCGIELSPARADDAEMVKEKLFQAKKEYDAEVQKFKKAITESLDKREDDARKSGNKKLVDQIKAEREAFDKTGELTQTIPATIQDVATVARTKLDKAYARASKEYLVLKNDDAVEATEKERLEFRTSAALQFGKRTYLGKLKPFDIRIPNSKEFPFEKDSSNYKLNGAVIPHSLLTHPDSNGEASVSYAPAGRIAFRVSVGIPKHTDPQQEPFSPVTFEVLGDNMSLWKSVPVTKLDDFQTCSLNVDKVKTLTLCVHCKNNNWAHAVWFGPFLAE